MTGPLVEHSIARFARGFRLRRDDVRGHFVVLGPERAFVPDAVATEILQRLDGAATLGAVIDALARVYDAPRPQIAGDVLAMVNDLAARGVLTV